MICNERDNPYYFCPANKQKAGTKIYSLTECSLSVNECDWYILAGKDDRINSHCLSRHTTRLLILFEWKILVVDEMLYQY